MNLLNLGSLGKEGKKNNVPPSPFLRKLTNLGNLKFLISSDLLIYCLDSERKRKKKKRKINQYISLKKYTFQSLLNSTLKFRQNLNCKTVLHFLLQNFLKFVYFSKWLELE